MKKSIFLFLFLSVFLTACDNERTSTPTFNPPEGTYHSAQTVTISTTTAGATIKYTAGPTDDIAPPTSSNYNGIVYTQPLTINKTRTIKTVCFKEGMNESVASARYIITACDCQNYIFCHDFERGDLYGHCSMYDYWQTDDPNNNYYMERAALANAGVNSSFGLKLTGASSNGRNGVFHYLSDITPTYIGFYVATMSSTGNTGFFDLSQSLPSPPTGKHQAILFNFGSDGHMHVNGSEHGAFSISRYYLIEFRNIQWDADPKPTFDFYVDGAPVQAGIAFVDDGITGFDFFMLYNLTSSEVWYDDIIMTD